MKIKCSYSLFFVLLFIVFAFAICISGFGAEKKNLLDALLDWSLWNAGIDPNSKDADNAKQLGKHWMNPLSSDKQIDEDLRQIRDSVVTPDNQPQVERILSDQTMTRDQKRQQIRAIIGDVKYCPVCNQKWPIDYIYCPYHGVILSLGEMKSSGKTIIAKDGSEMVLIPAGEFLMGSNFGEDNEKPVHKVWVDDFHISKHEVTVGQYKRFVKETGYPAPDWSKVNQYSPTDSHPIIFISWNDAKAYCDWAESRLPTEAEWEKAARGGLDGQEYPTGDTITTLRANYDNTYKSTTPVGKFPPNGFGLYDIAGNVWEWCEDYYAKDFYVTSLYKNPRGPNLGEGRVLRGGSWDDGASALRCAQRHGHWPTLTYSFFGFRSCQ